MGAVVISFLVSGRGLIFSEVARRIKAGDIHAQLGVVITDNGNAGVRERARGLSMRSFFVDPVAYPSRDKFDAQLLRILKRFKTDLVVASGYLKLLSPSFVRQYRNRIINIHPSLLPSFPGMHSQEKALGYGVKITGCTAHFVDEGIDTGPIIMQSAVQVLRTDTVSTLSARILKEETRVLSESIRQFCGGKLDVVDGRVVIRQ
jgi:phosphoribosylglycinamide formyltransferase-1